jgi:stringent starvation protein B
MTSNRPYLIRALYEWLVDNNLTPHLLVEANANDVTVPTQFIEDGKIVLNIGPAAVRHLEMGNERICFEARFGGSPMQVAFPPAAVLGIYARENGRGMLFPEEQAEASGSASDDEPEPPTPPVRPSLKVVK